MATEQETATRAGGLGGVLDGLRGLGVARLAALGVVAAALLALLLALGLRGTEEPMALLYADLDLQEAGRIVEALDRAHVEHRLESGGATIMVPAGQVANARLLLARAGLPTGGSVGYELFDRGDQVFASQFQQSVNQTRALEGELARTIRTVHGVAAARVHLVLPRRDPLSRIAQDAQASVLVTMLGANRLDQDSVNAIRHLVAAAVPGLRPRQVTLADSTGQLLSGVSGDDDGARDLLRQTDEARRAMEVRLVRSVEEMLERVVGPGRVRAEANVTLDHNTWETMQEEFTPDSQVPRSQQSVTNSSRSTDTNAATTVQNNLPNADAGAQANSTEQRQEETTNYELSRKTRKEVHDRPTIRRISVAVLIDDAKPAQDPKAPPDHMLSDADLARLDGLVRTAVGYDEARKDSVKVERMAFLTEAPPLPEPGVLGLPFERADLMRLAQTGFVGVVALLLLLLVVRPMVLRLAPGAMALPAGGVAGVLAGADGRGLMPASALAAMAGEDEPASDQFVSLTNVEGQMRASSIRRIGDLVERHPEESLAIVRAWLQEETAE